MLTNVREYLEFRCGETTLRRRILSFYGRSWRDSGGFRVEGFGSSRILSLYGRSWRAGVGIQKRAS